MLSKQAKRIYITLRTVDYPCARAYDIATTHDRAWQAGIDLRWEDEYEPWDADESCPRPEYVLCGVAYDSEGNVLTSLGMVGVDDMSDPYLLDEGANILHEALARLDAETSAKAARYATERVTYAG